MLRARAHRHAPRLPRSPPAVLHAEEQRREFDIHTYSDEILGRLVTASEPAAAAASSAAAPHLPPTAAVAAASSPVDFGAVLAAAGAPRYEVCRSFLAALMLANAGNVEIVPPADEAPAPVPTGRGAARAAPPQPSSGDGAAAESRFAARTGTFGVRLLSATARRSVEAFAANVAEARDASSAAAVAQPQGRSAAASSKRAAIEDAASGEPMPPPPAAAASASDHAALRTISSASAQPRMKASARGAAAGAGADTAAACAPSPVKPGITASPLAKRSRRRGAAVDES